MEINEKLVIFLENLPRINTAIFSNNCSILLGRNLLEIEPPQPTCNSANFTTMPNNYLNNCLIVNKYDDLFCTWYHILSKLAK